MGRIGCVVAVCLSVPLVAAPDPVVRTLVADGHHKRALAILEPRLKADPNDAEAAALLSRVRLALGDRDEAVRLAEIAVKADAKSADARWRLAEAVGQQPQRAGVLKQIGLARRFKREAEATLALESRHVDARTGLIVFYLNAPGIVGGDRKKAAQMVDEIAAIDAASGFIAQVRVIDESKGSGDIDGLLKKAIDAAKSPEIAYEARAGLMNRHLNASPPRLEAAEKLAREMIGIAPARQGGHSGLAIALATGDRAADLDAALAEAERAIPDNLNPTFQAGRVLVTRGADLARAERYFRKYLTQPAEGGMPPHAAAHWRLGLTLEKLGRKAEAIASLQEALRLNPSFEPAQKDLKRLR